MAKGQHPRWIPRTEVPSGEWNSSSRARKQSPQWRGATEAVREALEVVPVILTEVELWKPERLVLLDRNPRTHSDEQISQIAASMREFGFLWPIMVNGETRQIVAGNGRYLAALQLGLPVVPVVEERHLTAIQRRAFIIADNKIALNAGWADDILAEELPALRDAGLDLGLTGSSDDELEEILASVTARAEPEELSVPDPPEIPISRPGDLWHLGNHRVLCGDATKPEDVARVLAGTRADAVWTDPPYNVAYEGSAGSIKNDALSEEAFGKFLSAAFGSTIVVMKPGAPIYVAHSDTGGYTFRRCFMDAGFKLASCLIWKKNALVLSRGDYHWQHEPILYGWKPGAAHRWFGARDKTTIQEFDSPPFQQIGEQEWQIVLGETTLIVRSRLQVSVCRVGVRQEGAKEHNGPTTTLNATAAPRLSGRRGPRPVRGAPRKRRARDRRLRVRCAGARKRSHRPRVAPCGGPAGRTIRAARSPLAGA